MFYLSPLPSQSESNVFFPRHCCSGKHSCYSLECKCGVGEKCGLQREWVWIWPSERNTELRVWGDQELHLLRSYPTLALKVLWLWSPLSLGKVETLGTAVATSANKQKQSSQANGHRSTQDCEGYTTQHQPLSRQLLKTAWLLPLSSGTHAGISVILLESSPSATVHTPHSLISVEFSG